MKNEKMVVLLVPESAWDTLEETLQMDTQSKAFDKDLRKEIAAALEKVVKVEPKTIDEKLLRKQAATVGTIEGDIDRTDDPERSQEKSHLTGVWNFLHTVLDSLTTKKIYVVEAKR